MRDSIKLSLLIIASCLMIMLFLGQGLTPENYQFFLSLRVPKVLAILIAAISISTSSLIFQTITNNRILTPSILGFDSLYLLIQVGLLVVLSASSYWVINQISNFIVSSALMISASLLLFYFYFKRQQSDIFTLLLIGVICSSLFSSLSGFLTMLIDPNEFAVIQQSMFASFNNINDELVYWSLIPLVFCFAKLFTYCSKLDVLWLGQQHATSLGINCHELIQRVLILITIMIALSTALVGPILFFGLISVSLTRQLFRQYKHAYLIPVGSLIAILLLLSGQWFVEKVLTFETTISVIINLVGGTYFLFLLFKNKV